MYRQWLDHKMKTGVLQPAVEGHLKNYKYLKNTVATQEHKKMQLALGKMQTLPLGPNS